MAFLFLVYSPLYIPLNGRDVTMLLIIFLFIWNLLDLSSVYWLFKKKHRLFDDRFTTTMGMAITMTSAFAFALYLKLLLPVNQTGFYLVPIIVGVCIGLLFGSFIQSPALLTGIYNGFMGSIMGMMFGAVLRNPALCNIPIDSATMIESNIVSLTIFTACCHALVSQFIRYSFKV